MPKPNRIYDKNGNEPLYNHLEYNKGLERAAEILERHGLKRFAILVRKEKK